MVAWNKLTYPGLLGVSHLPICLYAQNVLHDGQRLGMELRGSGGLFIAEYFPPKGENLEVLRERDNVTWLGREAGENLPRINWR